MCIVLPDVHQPIARDDLVSHTHTLQRICATPTWGGLFQQAARCSTSTCHPLPQLEVASSQTSQHSTARCHTAENSITHALYIHPNCRADAHASLPQHRTPCLRVRAASQRLCKTEQAQQAQHTHSPVLMLETACGTPATAAERWKHHSRRGRPPCTAVLRQGPPSLHSQLRSSMRLGAWAAEFMCALRARSQYARHTSLAQRNHRLCTAQSAAQQIRDAVAAAAPAGAPCSAAPGHAAA